MISPPPPTQYGTIEIPKLHLHPFEGYVSKIKKHDSSLAYSQVRGGKYSKANAKQVKQTHLTVHKATFLA